MIEPKIETYGYVEKGIGFDGEGGWTMEGGEEAYNKALVDFYEFQSKNTNQNCKDCKHYCFKSSGEIGEFGICENPNFQKQVTINSVGVMIRLGVDKLTAENIENSMRVDGCFGCKYFEKLK